ncbi:MAG: D-alanyl-D-alanine carboxypeptidase/D-alanyl-D-alanine endopeptidase [Novosphingobium sp.]
MMLRTCLAPLLVFALVVPAHAETSATPLAAQVETILAAAPAGTRFGLLVTDPEGREVVAIDPDKRFIPASNTKLFTTAAALALLAPREAGAKLGTGDFAKFAPGAFVGLTMRDGGTPDVVLFGRGDARMSSTPDCKVDCLAELADIVARQARTVHDIVGDDTWFPDQRWSPGMSWNNIGTDSGTAISALSLDDNELPVSVAAAAPGVSPTVTVSPYFTVRNEAQTVASGATTLAFERSVSDRELRVYGEIAAGAAPFTEKLGIDDPAHYAAWRLAQLLRERGVGVEGTIASRHRPVGLVDDPDTREGREVRPVLPRAALSGGHTAPPLGEDVTIVNKVSQNLHAELLLRRIGRIAGTGSLADGIAAVEAMLVAAEVPRAGFDFSDGSGMSTYNRVSPRAAVALLRWGAAQPWGKAWRASFPVGGTDGTLRRRFAGTALQGKLFAKTGTLNATNALSGYLVAASGRELTFSFFANDVPEGGSALAAMDTALVAIAAAN